MAGEWRVASVRELALRVTKGTTPTTVGGQFVEQGINFVKVESITKDGRIDTDKLAHIDEPSNAILSRSVLEQDDVLFTIAGTIGRVAIVPASLLPANTNQAIAIVRPNPESVLPRYLYYVLGDKIRVQQAHTRVVQSVQANFSLGELSSLEVPLPPLPEQRAIVHILGSLDDKIELNRKMNETLEAMARAIFKSWFVEFDPVRAKAEGRKPVGMDEKTAALFPDSFVDSELGKIPKGWSVKLLSDLCSTQYGYTASAVDEPVGPKMLRVTDINKRNWIEWANVPHCVVPDDARAAYALQIGDLVVARMADPGKSAIIEEEIDAVFASYLVRLKTASLAHSYFVYGFLKSDLYAEYAEGAKGGSVQANMNAKVIVGAKLVVPPTKVIEKFLGVLFPLRQRLVANVQESHTLASTRDTLLPKLLSGEIRVKEAEKVVKSVT